MKILYSNTSSKGNCSVLESSGGSLLCIDCGIKYEKVNREIGYRLHECENLLLTHGHDDHSIHLNDFKKRGMIAFCGNETAAKSKLSGIYVGLYHKKQYEDESDGFRWISLSMVHTNSQDGSDCECFGFLIQDKGSGERCLWATDTMMIPYQFPPLDFYCIEANYWSQDDYLEDLEFIEKSVEMRRVRSHMSVETCASFLAKQDLSKCKEVRLLHLSNSMTKAERESIIPFIREKTRRSDLNVII